MTRSERRARAQRRQARRAKIDDTPDFLKRLMSSAAPTPQDAHEFVKLLYQFANATRREYAPRDVTALVRPKPLDFEQALTMVGPADADRMRQLSDRNLTVRRTIRRDQVIAALVSKAAATKDAIVTLCQSGHHTDAYTLTRTLLENVIVVSWLLNNRDSEKERIDMFVLHYEAFQVRFTEVMNLRRSHGQPGGHDSHAVSERTRELSSEVFDDRWMYWAWKPSEREGKKTRVTLGEMAREVNLADLYERDYFLLSAYVHSAPASVMPGPTGAAREAGVFTIDPDFFRGASAEWAAPLSIGLSNVLMLHLLHVVNERYDLGLSELIVGARAVMLATIPRLSAPT